MLFLMADHTERVLVFRFFLWLIILPIISIDIGKTLETDINLTTLLKTHKIVPLNDNYTNSQEGNADSDAKSLLIKSKICLLFQ